MQWLLDNWIWVLFGVGMVALHLFGHGRRGARGNSAGDASPTARTSAKQKPTDGNPGFGEQP